MLLEMKPEVGVKEERQRAQGKQDPLAVASPRRASCSCLLFGGQCLLLTVESSHFWTWADQVRIENEIYSKSKVLLLPCCVPCCTSSLHSSLSLEHTTIISHDTHQCSLKHLGSDLRLWYVMWSFAEVWNFPLYEKNGLIMGSKDFKYFSSIIPQQERSQFVFGLHCLRVFHFKNCYLSCWLKF